MGKKRWQYKVLDWPQVDQTKSLEDVLNSFGKRGWEATGVSGYSIQNHEINKESDVSFKIILKRKLSR